MSISQLLQTCKSAHVTERSSFCIKLCMSQSTSAGVDTDEHTVHQLIN